jgi:hypothetical protein
LHCLAQDDPDNPACPFEPYTPYELLENGRLAETAGDYALANDNYHFLLVLYPASKEANEGTLRLKGLGLNKDFGPDHYPEVATGLFAAADISEGVPLHRQAVLQDCSGWCVEAYWGDREGAKMALLAMLAAETDQICRDTINRALLEIDTYPPQGGMAATSPAALAQRRLTQQRMEHALLTYQRGQDLQTRGEVSQAPVSFQILGPQPNPFNPVTTLVVAVPSEGVTRVRIFNLLGQQVSEPLHQRLPAGVHPVRVDGARWASGVYVAVAEHADQSRTRKMLLLK